MRYTILIAALILSACAGEVHDTGGPNLSSVESEEFVAQRAIRQYIAAIDGPVNTQFQYVLEDMNGDGVRDVVALFTLPYSYWCGMSGCTMAILQGKEEGFKPVTRIASVYGPVVLTERSTSGWRDIAVRASGTNLPDRDVALQFDGQRYPPTPLNSPPLGESIYAAQGRRIFP